MGDIPAGNCPFVLPVRREGCFDDNCFFNWRNSTHICRQRRRNRSAADYRLRGDLCDNIIPVSLLRRDDYICRNDSTVGALGNDCVAEKSVFRKRG